MLSCDPIKPAKFVYGTLSLAKLEYYNRRTSKKCSQILVTWITIRQLRMLCLCRECDETPETVICPARLILSLFYSLNLLLCFLYVITEILATRAKFLDLSCYCSRINCAFTFRTTNVFAFFWGIMAEFELVKQKYLFRVHLCGFQITHRVNSCRTGQRTYYHYTTNHNGTFHSYELFQSRDISTTLNHAMDRLSSFWIINFARALCLLPVLSTMHQTKVHWTLSSSKAAPWHNALLQKYVLFNNNIYIYIYCLWINLTHSISSY